MPGGPPRIVGFGGTVGSIVTFWPVPDEALSLPARSMATTRQSRTVFSGRFVSGHRECGAEYSPLPPTSWMVTMGFHPPAVNSSSTWYSTR